MMKDKHEINKRGIMFYILLFMYIYLNVVSNHIIIVYEGKKCVEEQQYIFNLFIFKIFISIINHRC